jgi:phenylpyruvate tautomerase PptA (4-oxalocrotonate tautomerase family)
MPTHYIYHPKGAFSDEDKKNISKSITDLYEVLPKFYVVVLFVPMEKNDFYVGGEPTDNYVRIISVHLARQRSDGTTSDERYLEFVEKLKEVFRSFTIDRGFDYESHIEEIPRDGWRINGLKPPLAITQMEKECIKHNKAIPY